MSHALALVIGVGALGWPAFFVSTMLRDRPAKAVPACAPSGPSAVASAPPAAASAEPSPAPAPGELLLPPREAQASVAQKAREIVVALDHGDFAKIAEHVGAGGIDVSASAHPEVTAPARFSAASLRDCARDPAKRVWPSVRDAVPRTCVGYLHEVTGGEARSEPNQITYNGDLGKDEELSHLRKKYAGAILVDHVNYAEIGSHRHLHLVFLPDADSWRLAAIVGSADE